jgi:hypothetical protein
MVVNSLQSTTARERAMKSVAATAGARAVASPEAKPPLSASGCKKDRECAKSGAFASARPDTAVTRKIDQHGFQSMN